MSNKQIPLNNRANYSKIASCICSNGVILDTCVLLLLVVGLYDPLNITSHSGLDNTIEQFNDLSRVLSLTHKVYSTAYIAPEISNLLINRDKQGHYSSYQYEYVQNMINYFIHKDMVITYEELEAIVGHYEFTSLGVTDISILNMATLEEGPAVITDDGELYKRLLARDLPVLSVSELHDFLASI